MSRSTSGDSLSHAPVCPSAGAVAWCVSDVGDAAQAERPQRRHAERHPARDVTERVAALIAVRRCVGQFAGYDGWGSCGIEWQGRGIASCLGIRDVGDVVYTNGGVVVGDRKFVRTQLPHSDR